MANLKYDKDLTAPTNTNDDANVSWRLTRAAHLLGIEYPIIQAPWSAAADGKPGPRKRAGRFRRTPECAYVSAVEVARCP
jgi:hypothetical protein